MYAEFHTTDWTLSDNWIASSGVDAVHLEDGAGWVIERNHIYGVPQNAIFVDHLYGASISDNLIEGFGGTEQAGEWYGIYATVQADTASIITGNRNLQYCSEWSKES
ncbi:MAG: right-handed parallel beta-helix repeat-containing protein [Anaerolineales bacterium]